MLRNLMSTLQEYQNYFQPDAVPEALVHLIDFAARQNGWFSQGCEMDVDAQDAMFSTYSETPAFLDNLFHIAQADGTGSGYAIWRQGALDASPVVIFGSEGGYHVVAENLHGLLRILSLDTEPMASWEEVVYYKSDDHEPSEGAIAYSNWLTKTFDLAPVKDSKEVEAMLKAAQATHGRAFDTWVKGFQG